MLVSPIASPGAALETPTTSEPVARTDRSAPSELRGSVAAAAPSVAAASNDADAKAASASRVLTAAAADDAVASPAGGCVEALPCVLVAA
mmetsp:Transcript_7031/g.15489  ORF Transcript_7031/g.15489 Transcript_7031/m.15489 type:complete len:90 (+) Transcript_7031:468-737(+)